MQMLNALGAATARNPMFMAALISACWALPLVFLDAPEEKADRLVSDRTACKASCFSSVWMANALRLTIQCFQLLEFLYQSWKSYGFGWPGTVDAWINFSVCL